MNRYSPGNRLTLLRSGSEYFPALLAAIDGAQQEIWLETYLFADDKIGRAVAAALARAAQRGVKVRVMVDGWGAKHFLTPALEKRARATAACTLLKYRPEVAPWQFRFHRLRRLHRKLCHVDGRRGVRRRHQRHRRHEHAAAQAAADGFRGPRRGAAAGADRADDAARVGDQRAGPVPEHRGAAVPGARPTPSTPATRSRASSSATTCATGATSSARTCPRSASAKREIVIANSYFFPGIRFRRALIAAAGRGVSVTLLLQARVEYVLLHYASRALYGQLLAAGITIQEYHRSMLHAKVAVVDGRWATVGSSNIDPYSLLMAREANIIVRDAAFADQLRRELDADDPLGRAPRRPAALGRAAARCTRR